MHLGRLLPYRLVVGFVALFVLSGCVSDRYIGSIGRTGTYANRGYGLALVLGQTDVQSRWIAFDPRKPEVGPEKLRPSIRENPIDLNGDGNLTHDENMPHREPALRLVNKATSDATIDISVRILGGKNRKADFASYTGHVLKSLYKVEIPAGQWSETKIGSRSTARIAELKDSGLIIAFVDHPEFKAEDGHTRRQVVRVVLKSASITDKLKRDHRFILESLYLNPESARQTSLEQF